MHKQWSKWPKFVSLHYWSAPRDQGCQKIWMTKLKSTLVGHLDSVKIEETVKNCQNWTGIVKETLFSEGFSNLFNWGWILVLQLTRVVFSLNVRLWPFLKEPFITPFAITIISFYYIDSLSKKLRNFDPPTKKFHNRTDMLVAKYHIRKYVSGNSKCTQNVFGWGQSSKY